MTMDVKSILEIRSICRKVGFRGKLQAQVELLVRKESANGKPYWELRLRDAGGILNLRAWNDTRSFSQCAVLSAGMAVEVSGEFVHNGQYGLEARQWEVHPISKDEATSLFQESPSIHEDFDSIRQTVEKLSDPRLREISVLFLQDFGVRFCRTAAARYVHHAQRGGLCRHTAQMMRVAHGVAASYPQLNRDLLLAGVLFHDCGKLWEVCPPEQGFLIPHDLRGELMGHISIGIELINTLWRKLPLESWKERIPSSEDVRLHLIHMVAAHHGEYEFGSPVLPKTPEAIALHYIDNLDAKLEILAETYATSQQIAPAVFEKCRLLNVQPIAPLLSHC